MVTKVNVRRKPIVTVLAENGGNLHTSEFEWSVGGGG